MYSLACEVHRNCRAPMHSMHAAMKGFLLFFILLSPLICSCQESIQDIRLVSGTYGNHTGRVEVLYNNTWGAVCADGWKYSNAITICRQLNFPWAVCNVPYSNSPVFGALPDNGTIWISDVLCNGAESSLNMCSFRGFGVECDRGPAQVLCQTYEVDRPYNLNQTGTFSTAVRVEWTIPALPTQTEYIRHKVFVRQQTINESVPVKEFLTRQRRYIRNTQSRFSVVIHSLDVNATYIVQVRTDIRYFCRTSSFLQGRRSRAIQVQTTLRQISKIPIRLVPPAPQIDFMGRVEVFYNNSWGTVCDDGFSSIEADIVCQSLNFPEALCHVREAGLGRGEGPIWMDNVDCFRGADVLDDCDFNGWGDHNCGHDADIGVICLQDSHLSPVDGVTVDRVGATSVTLSWNAFPAPPLSTELLYQVIYSTGSRRSRSSVNVAGTETTVTLGHLIFNSTYSIQVRARFRYSFCGNFASGEYSETVVAFTVETSPTAPPSAFHIVVLNSTAIEFQWELPRLEHRNGVIQGYKLFVKPLNQMEQEIVIRFNRTTEYIVNGLTPNSVYTCSVLAFTVDDGPRSVFLTVITPDEGYVSLISEFGLNGDGLDRATVWPDQSDIRIHCGSGISSNVSVVWFKSDGTPVGSMDRNLRQVTSAEGTALLQIASNRLVTYCDAGVYSCVVNDSLGRIQTRDFKLLFTDVPSRPSSPYQLRVTSSSVTIGWNESPCDGGHAISGFTIRYRKTLQDYLITTNMYIYNINPLVKNYTIIGLEAYTPYNFSVQAISAEYLPSEFSLENIITTMTEAPSPPRSVRTKVVGPYTVEVQWTDPAEPNGIVTAYTVFVVNVLQPDLITREIELFEPFYKVFSGSTGSVNITVPKASAWYTFTVAATVVVGGEQLVGEKSLENLVYVPDPAVPSIDSVQVSSYTNSTITLTWDYPVTDQSIEGYQVAYAAGIEWTSEQGYLVQIMESKQLKFPYNVAMLTALTPDTEYRVDVSVLTEKGSGPSTSVVVTTLPAFKERIAYFQLMIGPIARCFEQNATAGFLEKLHTSILEEINRNLCPTCGLGIDNVRNGEISCSRIESDQLIAYRARIVGTNSHSASDLVNILARWVQTGQASISIDSVRLQVESQCETSLDRPSAPDCFFHDIVTTTIMATTTEELTSISSSVKPSFLKDDSLRGGEIGGLVIGALIAVLLVLFIVLLVLLLARSCRSDFRAKKLVNEDISGLAESSAALDNPIYDSDATCKKE